MMSDNSYDSALSAWFSSDVEGGDSFGLPRTTGGDPEAIERVREWVRQRFNLSPEDAIMVSEINCSLPGCPPIETVVAFWENGTRHHFKLFRPVAEVTLDLLPFAWMKDSLVMAEGFGCECC